MPIKKENRHRYPPDWKERRERVLERAGHCCELCAAPNHARIAREIENPARWIAVLSEAFKESLSFWDYYRKPIRVVLTIAHLDPTYRDHDIKYLLALCQRCHLKIDAHVHAQTRQNRKEVKTHAKSQQHATPLPSGKPWMAHPASRDDRRGSRKEPQDQRV